MVKNRFSQHLRQVIGERVVVKEMWRYSTENTSRFRGIKSLQHEHKSSVQGYLNIKTTCDHFCAI